MYATVNYVNKDRSIGSINVMDLANCRETVKIEWYRPSEIFLSPKVVEDLIDHLNKLESFAEFCELHERDGYAFVSVDVNDRLKHYTLVYEYEIGKCDDDYYWEITVKMKDLVEVLKLLDNRIFFHAEYHRPLVVYDYVNLFFIAGKEEGATF